MQRSSQSELLDAADALVVLASLVASGLSLMQAIGRWEQLAPVGCRAAIADIRRRLTLVPDTGVLDGVADSPASLLHPPLVAAAGSDRRSGRSTITILRSSAETLRRRAGDVAEAVAHTSGARTSARVVAGLPVAFLLLVPVAGLPELDAVGSMTIALGVGLIVIGVRWMARWTPVPRAPSSAADVFRELSASVRAGLPVGVALSGIAQRCSWAALTESRQAVGLGIGWSESLSGSGDPDASKLAAIIDGGRRSGSGLVHALERAAEDLCERDRRGFEERLRRAPVLLVIPLVLTVLPGFALLTLGPFLRQLLA